MILTLGDSFHRLQVKRRTCSEGKDIGIDAFDFTDHINIQKLYKQVPIPKTGYIFQPNQTYIFQGDGVVNTLENFNQQLTLLGVTLRIVNRLQYILEFKYPVKMYPQSSVFLN